MTTKNWLLMVILAAMCLCWVGCQQPTQPLPPWFTEMWGEGFVYFYPDPANPANSELFLWWDNDPDSFELKSPMIIADTAWYYLDGILDPNNKITVLHTYRVKEVSTMVIDSLGHTLARNFYSEMLTMNLESGTLINVKITAPSLLSPN